jgi:hypothetical protein
MHLITRRLARALVTGAAGAALAATPALASVDPLVTVSGTSPFATGCNGAPQTGTVFTNAEVEPWADVNLANDDNVVGAWQQDRWSNGGANGNLSAYSTDGGQSWTTPPVSAASDTGQPKFSRCTGGNASNGGDYERATDPWVSFGRDGTAYQMALSLDVSTGDPNLLNVRDAMLVSTSTDGGRTWDEITPLITDDSPLRLNDKNSLTADPTRNGFAYAVWDRLEIAPDLQSFRGPTLFTRTTDGGQTWEPPRVIFDPGVNNQTIANQIAVLPNGRLVNVFDWIIQGQLNVGVMFSDDRGRTWTEPRLLNALGTIGITDPFDGAPVRTGDLIPDIAVDPRKGRNTIYVVWQDARFAEGLRDQIALVRSSDGGRTWTTPRRVSSNLGTQAFTASVEVNDRGRVGVTYYDFTRDDPTTQPLLTDHWLTVSSDQGESFSARERQTASSFDMRLAPLTGTGFFVGDYVGLDGVGRRFHPVFGVTRSVANAADIVSTTARPPFGASVAASQRDPTAAASTAVAGSTSRLGYMTSN